MERREGQWIQKAEARCSDQERGEREAGGKYTEGFAIRQPGEGAKRRGYYGR